MVILTVIAVIGAVVLAVVGIALLVRRARHPKCPRCKTRVGFAIPLLLARCQTSYRCDNCNQVFEASEIRRERRRRVRQ